MYSYAKLKNGVICWWKQKHILLTKRLLSSNEKWSKRKNEREKNILPQIFLETEIFHEYKDILYRGLNINELCESSSFDEVIFLLLYKKLPTWKELNDKRNLFRNCFNQFDATNILKINSLWENENLIELVRLCTLRLSLNNRRNNNEVNSNFRNERKENRQVDKMIFISEDQKIEHNKNYNISYYEYLAACLKVTVSFFLKSTNIEMGKNSNFCSFFVETCAHISTGEIMCTDNKRERNDEMKEKKKKVEQTTVNSNEQKNKYIIVEKIKLFNALLILLCENNINETSYLIRLLSNTQNNYFNLCLSAINLYIDIFKKTDWYLSLTHFQNFHFENSIANDTRIKDEDPLNMEYVDLFFHRNNYFFKKNQILKAFLEKYCSSTSNPNTNLLVHFSKIEKYLLEVKKKYASSYFYTLLTFHILNIPFEFIPVIYILARLLGFTAHVNEQRKNNKLVKYTGVYIGSAPVTYTDIHSR